MTMYSINMSEITLTDRDKKLLRKVFREKSVLIPYECSDYNYLIDKCLVKINQERREDDNMIEIISTPNTERYYSYRKPIKVESIRNWITTIIAIAAFILSVISIVLQYI